MSQVERDRETFEAAYNELLKELPDALARALARLSAPGMRWVRFGFGVLFIVGGLLSFLPVLGFELLPLGVLLLAQDAPVLHRPVGAATLWVVAKVREIKACVRERIAAVQ